jgi:hypothetical protein
MQFIKISLEPANFKNLLSWNSANKLQYFLTLSFFPFTLVKSELWLLF